MRAIIGLLVAVLALTGCSFAKEKAEYVEPSISFAVPKQLGPTDMEKEQIAEAEARLAEIAEQKRIADLEAENQRVQKEAEEARNKAIEKGQAQAARELAERLEREKKVIPPLPPADPTGGYAWIDQMQTQYGVFATAGTTFKISETNPCGGAAVGCFTAWKNHSTGKLSNKIIWIHPSEIGRDPWILFHEIGHSHGIPGDSAGECQADQFARQYLPEHVGAYC